MDVRSINLTLRHFSLLLLQRPPTSTLFPYTTLFRSSSDITTGAESDIQQLTRIARGMVGRWGMSRAIGPIAVIPQDGMSPLLPGVSETSEATQRLVDEEVRRIVESAHTDVSTLLREHRSNLDSLVTAL